MANRVASGAKVTSARVILLNMDILLVLKPEAPKV
jgi:hypothetical protein